MRKRISLTGTSENYDVPDNTKLKVLGISINHFNGTESRLTIRNKLDNKIFMTLAQIAAVFPDNSAWNNVNANAFAAVVTAGQDVAVIVPLSLNVVLHSSLNERLTFSGDASAVATLYVEEVAEGSVFSDEPVPASVVMHAPQALTSAPERLWWGRPG